MLTNYTSSNINDDQYAAFMDFTNSLYLTKWGYVMNAGDEIKFKNIKFMLSDKSMAPFIIYVSKLCRAFDEFKSYQYISDKVVYGWSVRFITTAVHYYRETHDTYLDANGERKSIDIIENDKDVEAFIKAVEKSICSRLVIPIYGYQNETMTNVWIDFLINTLIIPLETASTNALTNVCNASSPVGYYANIYTLTYGNRASAVNVFRSELGKLLRFKSEGGIVDS